MQRTWTLTGETEMENTLRELVDDLPTQSLEIYVQHYEAGEVGGFLDVTATYRRRPKPECRCPRACLGFEREDVGGWGVEDIRVSGHPAGTIEDMALGETLDTAELYSECVLAIAERDASLDDLPQPEREAVGAG